MSDLVRGASGGMLFGVPLLYTMEVWWIGSVTSPIRMLVVMGLTFAVVLLLSRTSGFRSTADVRIVDAVKDSVEAVAIGVVSVTGVLVLIREITLSTPLPEVLGKIVYEATPFVIGVGLARHILGRGGRTDPDDADADEDEDAPEGAVNATVADVGATLLGAFFVAFNIAPTDEVPMISAAMSPAWKLALVGASLVISYCIVFEAGFSSERDRRAQQGGIQHPVTETVVCYLLALVAAVAMLFFFQRAALDDPPLLVLGQVVVLGLPAAVGGAAGRLAV